MDAVTNGTDALDYFAMADYDVAVLDIMMPGMDGISLVKEIRRRGIKTPVLFLTAKDSVDDKVSGLDAGADDYLIKPFDFKELLARIRALSRKYGGDKASAISVGDLILDTAAHTVFRGDQPIDLSAKEFALLEVLMKNVGRVLSRDQIEASLYNFDYDGSSNVIDVYISFLRKKIDADYEKKYIKTVRGSGFMLREP